MKFVYIKKEDKIERQELETILAEVVKEHSVPDYNEEYGADRVVNTFAGVLVDQKDDPDWTTFPEDKVEAYKAAYEALKALGLGESKANAEAYEKDAAGKKEQAKKDKEAKEAKLVEAQSFFAKVAGDSVDDAKASTAAELESLKGALPDGVTIQSSSVGGLGLVFAEGVSQESIAKATALFAAKAEMSELVKGQMQFLAGDAVNAAVATGTFKTAKAAAASVAESMTEAGSFKISGSQLENYARMASRCEVDKRNLSVEPTAYLAVSNAALPKKQEGQSKEDFEAAKVAHEEDRQKLFAGLRDGKMSVVDPASGEEKELALKGRSDVLPLVQAMQVNHGVAKKPDPDKRSASELATTFLFATIALGVLCKDGKAVFECKAGTPGSEAFTDKAGKERHRITLPQEQLTAMRDEAYGLIVKDKIAEEAVKGVKTVEVNQTETVDDKEVVKKDPITKEPLKEEVEVPVYQRLPFDLKVLPTA